MAAKKLLVITGDQFAHKYFLHKLNSIFYISSVLIESIQYPDPTFKSREEKETWDNFFSNRQKAEKSLLKIHDTSHIPHKYKKHYIETGFLNNDKTLALINKIKPDQIIIFGSSLLGPKYLDLYPNRILNLHVGLSQFYRGSSCNFWPIYDLKPQFLGATVHYVSNKIDGGNIVVQDKINLNKNDSEFVLMTKTIILGTKLMIEAIKIISFNFSFKGTPNKKGSLYLIKDFLPNAIKRVSQDSSSGDLSKAIVLAIDSK
jgi:folate-dependent phosphoribosylglycinamide formyltransferase PurN